MAFACIYISGFLVQAVERAELALRGDRVALALLGGKAPLWSVVAASSAALRMGVQLGMTKAQVAEFVGVEVRHRSEAQEKATHAALLDVAWSISPRVEDAAPDTIVLDLEGLASLFGSEEEIARVLMERVTRVGVNPNIAIASNIEAAILAARGFSGIAILPAGEEAVRLGVLPVRTLSSDAEILETLDRWGIEKLRALAALPVLQLSERLGQRGVILHELARGARVRALVLAQVSLTFEEEMELDETVEELEPLSFLLGRLLDQLCARLESRALAVQTIRVWFELEPSFEKDVQSLNDESRKKTASKEFAKVLTLPMAMRDAKALLKLLRLSLQSDPPKSPIQKIRMTAEAAAPRVAQSGLFVPRGPDPEKLELTVARLMKLVGESNVGVAELIDTHRAENFRVARWNCGAIAAEEGRSRRVGRKRKSGSSAEPTTADGGSAVKISAAGFRVLRPPLMAMVEADGENERRPVRVSFSGMRGDVIAASGPWRSSGEWWQEDGWDHDEWDLAIDFGKRAEPREQKLEHIGLVTMNVNALKKTKVPEPSPWPRHGVYRIFYDLPRKSWFVRGFYD
ncbi:MAG: DNA polymerase Y family protein [Acidobacteria bacterium]|nr:DNA polymerase Y family protein [Acidobacteriota bacterium]